MYSPSKCSTSPNDPAADGGINVAQSVTNGTGSTKLRVVDGIDSSKGSRAQRILVHGARQLLSLGRLDLAESLALKALAEDEGSADCHSVMANVLDQKGEWDGSLVHLRRAYELAPQAPQVRLNLALALLRLGNLAEGLPLYEARLDKPAWAGFATRESRTAMRGRLLQPGAAVAGQRIVVLAEQGLGDGIMFARFVPLLAKRGARVALACQPGLRPFFANIAGVETLLSPPDDQPLAKLNLRAFAFDAWAPLVSLWLWFGGTIENVKTNGAYWQAEGPRIAAWRDRFNQLGRAEAPKVGIVYQANPASVNHGQRSLAVRDLHPLLALEQIDFINLQHGKPGRELAAAFPQVIDPLRGEIPLDDYGAAIAATDLLISVDTMAAHLAGAMAHPVWITVPHSPHWAWGFDRPATSWYPSARLLRQNEPRHWLNTIQLVAAELRRRFLQDSGVSRG
jgi:tetratricopeptide (TPR) repeat protein